MAGRVRTKAQILADLAVAPSARPVLLVSGFWRSGTTWALEVFSDLLGAKSVFEPFNHYAPEYARAYGHVPKTYMHDGEPELYALFNRAASGRMGAAWTRTSRRTVAESFRRSTVVKLINGQFCLNDFGVPVVHVSRSPYGVLASLLRRSFRLWMGDIDLNVSLPARIAAENELLIRETSEMEWWQRVIAMWWITEEYVGRQGVTMVNYEDLARDPSLFVKTCEQMGLPLKKGGVELRDSAMTYPQRKNTSTEDRINSWRNELLPEQVAGVDAVLAICRKVERRSTA